MNAMIGGDNDILAGIFGLLANPGRLKILRFLVSQQEAVSTSEIAGSLQMPESTVSKHLGALWVAQLARMAPARAHVHRGRATLSSDGYCAEESARRFLEVAEKCLGRSDELTTTSP